MPSAKRKKRPRIRSPYVNDAPRPATPRQLVFLKAVAELTAQLGRPPLPQEVGERIGVTRLGARRQLQALEKKGLLRDVPRVVSSGQWALTETGARALGEEE